MELTMLTSGGFGGEASFDLSVNPYKRYSNEENSGVDYHSLQLFFALEFDKEKNQALSYTKVLPLPLTTPDFSMPTMSSESLARCLHCILDRCSVRYEDEWERRKGFLTVKVTLSWIVFVVCSLDHGP
ncbi:hypothetical protein POTOM_011086 [Populus tomentosa]|uniref:Uncharacterized protein n=1 Tax=Populus tomentosa TaxID=118781 RepID=A0A8X8AB95_POPTO|nr:hypothetical protein POTOM_011086 [Populus tomentosa]